MGTPHRQISTAMWVRIKKNVSMIIGFFESLLFAGIVFGWPSLVFVFREAELFSYLCHDGEGNSTGSELDTVPDTSCYGKIKIPPGSF